MYACASCGRTYPTLTERYRCECGEPLTFADEPTPDGNAPHTLDRERGIWAFADLLAVEQRVTLGEGWTPLIDAPERPVEYKLDWL